MPEKPLLLNGHPFIPYHRERSSPESMLDRARDLKESLAGRRSIRHFSADPVPEQVLKEAVAAASTAPSGANMQPWKFVLVGDPELKRKIREGAEKEEFEAYHGRMPEEWLEALAPLQTDWHKEFLEVAPWLIVVFKTDHHRGGDGRRVKHYYVNESVGLACGFLLATLHLAGLSTLTHTPSPMAFLREILGRPADEKPFLLIPVGYPADDALVPDIHRKPLDEVLEIRR